MTREITLRISTAFTSWVIQSEKSGLAPRTQRAFLKKIISAISDPNPELSLSTTANDPFPYFGRQKMGPMVSPLEKWNRVAEGSLFWPSHVRAKAKPLGLESGKLPTWKQVERYFDSLGLKAVPVLDYVGGPLYSFLISQNYTPICTSYVMRYKRAPYFYIPADALHDISHGFSHSSSDYRRLFSAFAKASLKQPAFMSSPQFEQAYYRYFEYSYVYTDDGKVEPIGPTSYSFENIVFDQQGLKPALKDLSRIRLQKKEFRPFRSRQAWADEASRFIRMLEAKDRA